MLKRSLLIAILLPITLLASPLTDKVTYELELLDLPAASWRGDDDDTCDVAIIGAGMSGISLAGALKHEGITNVRVFDSAESGKEGPWLTCARMKTLRSGKNLPGPALGIPHLTFRAWYEANHGKKAWDRVGRIPTQLWGNYLHWLKKALDVKVENGCTLSQIQPNPDQTLQLIFENGKEVLARKVVLATGRGGYGSFEVPDFMQGVPKRLWAHTSQVIDPATFLHKRVCVIGVGASGFDAAATALENGAKSVKMLMRRATLPVVNHFANFAYPGFSHGFYYLTDKERTDFFSKAVQAGIPPPEDSIKRLEPFKTFDLIASTEIDSITVNGNALSIKTNKGPLQADYLILATGYGIDGSKQPELQLFYDKILLWQDRNSQLLEKMGRYPYLGRFFEFLEKEPGSAPFLEHIHCFNHGAFLSHGRISGDIDCIPIGIKRLAEGIAIGLFLQDTCRAGSPQPYMCPGTCQSGLCSPFSH